MKTRKGELNKKKKGQVKNMKKVALPRKEVPRLKTRKGGLG